MNEQDRREIERQRIESRLERIVDHGKRMDAYQLTGLDCLRHRIKLRRLAGYSEGVLNQCEDRFRRTFGRKQ